MSKFRTRLEQLRKEKDLSRMDIVRQAGVSYMTVQRWERLALHSIDAPTLTALCKVLDCQEAELVYTVEENGNGSTRSA